MFLPSVHLCSAPRSIPYTLKSSTTVETGPAIKNKNYLLNPIWFQDSSPSTHSLSSNRQCHPLWVLPPLLTASHLQRKQMKIFSTFYDFASSQASQGPSATFVDPSKVFYGRPSIDGFFSFKKLYEKKCSFRDEAIKSHPQNLEIQHWDLCFRTLLTWQHTFYLTPT